LSPPKSVVLFGACLTSIDRRLEFAKPRDCDYTSGMTKDQNFSLDKSAPSERIAKRIARAGLCSRREAEARIADGRVSVNGKTITSPALNVSSGDRIIVDGKPLPAREPAKLWRYYKPRGLVVSARDEKNRETIFDRLPSNLPRLISIGRLDMDSEGLLLLTNDGDLARHLELPATGWSRKYRVRVQGQIDEASLTPLADGVTIDGVRYGSVIATLDRQMPSNAWLTIAIREGKNREVRRIMEYLGHRVGRLIRVSYGPFQLGDLPEGGIEPVKARVLADQLGISGGEPDSANDAKPKLRAKSKPKGRRDGAGRPAVKRGQNADHRGPSSRRKTGGPRRK
jgi:23S rRNA pseudouridine2605 synthase